MAGELLFRVLERTKFDTALQRGALTVETWDALFLDGGQVSLTEAIGQHYVVIDGPAFASDAPWLYDEQEAFVELSPEEAEWATLAVPKQVVQTWKQRLQALPGDGPVATTAAKIRDALVELMTTTEATEQLTLTVECLL